MMDNLNAVLEVGFNSGVVLLPLQYPEMFLNDFFIFKSFTLFLLKVYIIVLIQAPSREYLN